MSGRLYGLGLGPGDPELITLKARRILDTVHVVAVPRGRGGEPLVLDLARPYLNGHRIIELPTPMTRDPGTLAAAHARAVDILVGELGADRDVALLTLGDPSLYSTFGYLAGEVAGRGFAVEVVPGISSPSAAAARLAVPLAQGMEGLAILAGVPSEEDFRRLRGIFRRLVILKPRSGYGRLREMLEREGLLGSSRQVSWLGWPNERISPLGEEPPDYFTLILIDMEGQA